MQDIRRRGKRGDEKCEIAYKQNRKDTSPVMWLSENTRIVASSFQKLLQILNGEPEKTNAKEADITLGGCYQAKTFRA
jgi:hypothetical protein